MDRTTVIVALPAVAELVNKISSEDVAHLTVLYLGEASLSEEAILYVQHACAELSPFGLSVDHRGTLGSDDADVLFFEKSRWDLGRVAEFRHHLLLNDEIKRAYDAVEQFPEWTPHLTLGYPEAPARELDDDDHRMGYVQFDRISVWTEDFSGPEFRLKYDDYPMEMAMSGTTAEVGALVAAAIFSNDPNSLKQYGKKGMKWGVRNDEGHKGEQVKTKQLDKLDKKWEKENTGMRGYIKVHNAVADRMNNGEIDRFNNEPRWKKASDDGFLLDDRHPETKAYFDAYETLSNKIFAEEGAKLGSNPSGTKHYEMREDEDGNPYAFLAPTKNEVKHAEGDKDLVFKIERSEDGQITGLTETEVELKHYGVKGMRWGVTTKDRAAQTTPQAVTVTQKKAGTYAKAKGGKGHEINEDAATALAARQKAKASTTDALSNKELQAAVTRMQLEQQYSSLAYQSDRRSKGARFAAGLFGAKRYTGEKRKYKDFNEELGGQIRDALVDDKQ